MDVHGLLTHLKHIRKHIEGRSRDRLLGRHTETLPVLAGMEPEKLQLSWS